MSMLLFVAAMFFAGHQLSEWSWSRSARAPLHPLERLCSSALLGFILWLATSWALALVFLLHAVALQVCALVAAAGGLALRRARRTDAPVAWPAAQPWWGALLLLPLIAWVAFLLWRGYLLPPHTPDALTYHMPRAAMIAATGGFRFFHLPDLRIDRLPANYELLLADFLVLDGADTFAEWLSTGLCVLLLLETAALAARWWGSGLHVYVGVLLVAAAPVLLLQGAATKNDAMAGYLLLAALRWLGRLGSEREVFGAVLVIVAACAAGGTKAQGLLFALLAAPCVLWFALRAVRDRAWRPRQLALLAAVALAGAVLLGGPYYAYAALDSMSSAKAPGLSSAAMPVAYGAWAHLWQVPLLILLAPFAASHRELYVPWNGEHWLWERYDVHASNYGVAFTCLAVLLPLALWMLRREPDPARVRERSLVGVFALVIGAAILPTNFTPQGYVSAFPRYLLFLPAILVGWTACGALARLERARSRLARPALAAIAAASAFLFIDTASDMAQNDKFAPLRFLQWAEERPGTRWVPLMPWRSANVLDCLAGPRDRVDFNAGHDSWIYPVFGRANQRDVRFIRRAEQIRPDAQWVIVDLAYNAIWRHPDFRNIADWRRYLGKGSPRSEDLALIEALRASPDFRLEFVDEKEAQAVFRRLPAPPDRRGLDFMAETRPDLGACTARKS